MGDPGGETEGGRFSQEEADAGDGRAFARHLALRSALQNRLEISNHRPRDFWSQKKPRFLSGAFLKTDPTT
jgi:hypothetical protein